MVKQFSGTSLRRTRSILHGYLQESIDRERIFGAHFIVKFQKVYVLTKQLGRVSFIRAYRMLNLSDTVGTLLQHVSR